MDVIVLNALQDNLMYLLVDRESKACAAVDPVSSEEIYNYASKHKLNITHVLTTHHHWDHAGGNKSLLALVDGPVTVTGGDDRVESINMKVADGQKIVIGNSVEVECLLTPCHTRGHVCYVARNVADDKQDKVVFTGDTLFIAGCGRFFEGDAQDMFASLLGKLVHLPSSTKVYCGHEYTVKNLKFALTIEPQNVDIARKLEWAEKEISSGRNTVPSTIGEETRTNPFMRVENPDIWKVCDCSDALKAMEILRRRKDVF